MKKSALRKEIRGVIKEDADTAIKNMRKMKPAMNQIYADIGMMMKKINDAAGEFMGPGAKYGFIKGLLAGIDMKRRSDFDVGKAKKALESEYFAKHR